LHGTPIALPDAEPLDFVLPGIEVEGEVGLVLTLLVELQPATRTAPVPTTAAEHNSLATAARPRDLIIGSLVMVPMPTQYAPAALTRSGRSINSTAEATVLTGQHQRGGDAVAWQLHPAKGAPSRRR
jgi:hypothetical protein